MKKYILKVMFWATIALVIPLTGNQLIEGWKWNLGDFIFAWVFLVLMGITVWWASKRASSTKFQVVIGTLVFLVFVFIWIVLATG